MAKYKKINNELLALAAMGDSILNCTIHRLLDLIGAQKFDKHYIGNSLKSNDFIKHFHSGFVYKGNLPEEFAGDIVEARIAFLYLNYGMGAATRYIHREIRLNADRLSIPYKWRRKIKRAIEYRV